MGELLVQWAVNYKREAVKCRDITLYICNRFFVQETICFLQLCNAKVFVTENPTFREHEVISSERAN